MKGDRLPDKAPEQLPAGPDEPAVPRGEGEEPPERATPTALSGAPAQVAEEAA